MDLIEETGMPHVEVLSTVSIISRLIVQNIRHRYLSFIYNELLSHGTGNQIYIRSCGEFAGNNLAELSLSFPKAILLGIYRNNEAILNAPLDFVIEESDSGIFMAHSHDDTFTFLPKIFDQPISDLELSSLTDVEKQRCILILGWNNKCIEILNEFNSYQNENFTIDILSAVPSEQRQNATRTKFKNLKHASVTHIDADYTSLPLHQLLDLKRYDNILVVANDWLDSDEQVDARSLHGYLRLISSLKKVGHSCDILVELMNGENEKTFPKSRGEILVSPMVISHILAHMTLKPELNEVFEEIFGPLGSEIKFIPALEFGCTPECNFVDIQTLALSRNAIALGIAYCQNGPNFSKPNIYLNPDRRLVFNFGPNDKVIVLDNS